MNILQDLNNLYDKWESEGGKSGSDRYEDALYKCINELGDFIIKHEKESAIAAVSLKDQVEQCTCEPGSKIPCEFCINVLLKE